MQNLLGTLHTLKGNSGKMSSCYPWQMRSEGALWGVILASMGSDGARGMGTIKDRGGSHLPKIKTPQSYLVCQRLP